MTVILCERVPYEIFPIRRTICPNLQLTPCLSWRSMEQYLFPIYLPASFRQIFYTTLSLTLDLQAFCQYHILGRGTAWNMPATFGQVVFILLTDTHSKILLINLLFLKSFELHDFRQFCQSLAIINQETRQYGSS